VTRLPATKKMVRPVAEQEKHESRSGSSVSWVPTLLIVNFGPQMALIYRLDAISQGPKNARIQNIMHGAV
jgi:hypothetical protein